MKVYKEMTILSKKRNILELKETLSNNSKMPWFYNVVDYGENYINVEYVADEPCSADIALLYKKDEKSYSVVNIIPIDKNELSIDEYNEILNKFHDFLTRCTAEDDFEIFFSNTGIITKEQILSEQTLKDLEAFSLTANKSTGSSHPSDRNRWYKFIIQSFKSEDYKDLLPDTLQNLLIEDYKWTEQQAIRLVNEYEFSIGLLLKLEELA